MSTPDPTEDRFRRTAQRFHDDVAATVDLDAALDRSRRPSRRPVALAVSALAVLALVATVALSSADDGGDVDVAIDEDGLTDPDVDAPQPDFDSAPAPIALGGPTDGKDSVGLPVVVEPATGLTDGQTVSVSGQGFPPNESVGVVMCTREAGRDHGARGVEACNINQYGSGTTDAQGNVTVDFQVRRLVTLDGQEVDCASEPGRCIIGMGMISDYDQSGGFAVDFDPSVPVPDPPTIEVSQTSDIADGQTVDVVVSGLAPNSYLYVQQCAELGCIAATADVEARADGEGTYRGSVRLWRLFGQWGPGGPTNIDCATVGCHLDVEGDSGSSRDIPTVPLSFDPDRGARTAPVLRLLDEGPFQPGDRFEVAVDGTTARDFVDIQVCAFPNGDCVAYGATQGADGVTVVEVVVDGAAGVCATGCPVNASIYSESGPTGPSGPPPMFPEPIMVTITG